MKNILTLLICVLLVFDPAFSRSLTDTNIKITNGWNAQTVGDLYQTILSELTTSDKKIIQDKIAKILDKKLPHVKVKEHKVCFSVGGNSYAIDLSQTESNVFTVNNHKFNTDGKTKAQVYLEIENWINPSQTSSLFFPRANAFDPFLIVYGVIGAFMIFTSWVTWGLKSQREEHFAAIRAKLASEAQARDEHYEVALLRECKKMDHFDEQFKNRNEPLPAAEIDFLKRILSYCNSEQQKLIAKKSTTGDAYECLNNLIKQTKKILVENEGQQLQLGPNTSVNTNTNVNSNSINAGSTATH